MTVTLYIMNITRSLLEDAPVKTMLVLKAGGEGVGGLVGICYSLRPETVKL